MMIHNKLTLLFAITCLLAMPAFAQFGMAGPDIEYEVVQEKDAAPAGSEVRLLFTFTLDDRWHVNAHEPLEQFLIPTVLSIEEDERYTVKAIVYPEYKLYTFDFSEEPLAVYEDVFYIGAVLQLQENLEPGEILLNGQIRYQACDDTQCAPPRTKALEISLIVAD